jgi:hypothetical protein
MNPKRAACDPCREAKLACGHEWPACTRCRHREKASICVYRSAPFKRTRGRRRSYSNKSLPNSTLVSTNPSPYTHYQYFSLFAVSLTLYSSRRDHAPHLLQSLSNPRQNHYPNPGYLGQSSHVAIFNHVLSEQNSNHDPEPLTRSISASLSEHPSVKEGALLTRQLFSSFNLTSLHNLVKFWRAKDVSLAGAEPFVDLCADSSNYTSLSDFQGSEWHLQLATRLSQNTAQPLEFNRNSTISSYSAQFIGINTRWETLGIFLSAAIQATRDVPFFPSLYTTSSRNGELRRLLTSLSDCSLHICLSADRLNDLQLVLQYENFIVHSYVDGDQSRSQLPAD